MRRRPILALLLWCAALLAGCGPAATPTLAPTAAPTAGQPTAPASPADTLRWSFDGIGDLNSLDPAKPIDSPSVAAIGLVFSGLIRLDEHLQVQPDNAERWTVSPDGKTYTFTLREGLTFADGTPVTAADFVYAINRALAPATASYGAPFHLSHIVGAVEVIEGRSAEASGVRAIDQRTLEIALTEPRAYFLSQLAYTYTFAVPRALVESRADWERVAYGTGPFRVREWTPGEKIVLEANQRYWRGRPGFATVELIFSPSGELAYNRYLAGELDIFGSQQNPIPAGLITDARLQPGFHETASLTTRYIGFNNLREPFDDPQVRRALALAVDRQQLSGKVFKGAVLPATRILPPGLLGTELPVRELAFDPQKAQQELEAAGYPGGMGLPPLELAYEANEDNDAVASALRDMWRESLGVTVQLHPMPIDRFIKELDTTYLTPAEGLQFYISVWGADYPDPQNFLSQQLRTDTPNNNGHFSNQRFDQLVDEADLLGAAEAIDQRLQLYNAAEQIAIDEVGWLPLYHPSFTTLVRPELLGFAVTPQGIAVDWAVARRETP